MSRPTPDNCRGPRAPRRRHPGLTMMELVVAISVFLVVIAMLGFPLFTAFGYIQKVIARSEVQAAGRRAAQELRLELERADEVADLPPTGDWLTLLFAETSGSADVYTLGSPGATVRVVRYARHLDFPWRWDGGWTLLRPDYAPGPEALRYANNHLAFYQTTDDRDLNPFTLTRFALGGLTYASAVKLWLGVDEAGDPIPDYYGTFPLDTPAYDVLTGEQRYRDALRRKAHGEVIAVTPHGAEWDVARFQATPLRILKETLARPAGPLATRVGARYPLWAGRTRDTDAAPDPTVLYQLTTADLTDFIDDQFPLYRTGTAHNPFGYQVQVFDDTGASVYGMNSASVFTLKRHYMEWPPIDRLDLVSAATNQFSAVAWSLADVRRQRREGTVVFEQPLRAALAVANGRTPYALTDAGGGHYLLPTPPSWSPTLTYRVQPPQQITVSGVTYRLVDKETPGSNEFTLAYRVAGLDGGRTHGTAISTEVDGWQMASREIVLPDIPADLALTKADYTVCDLQPGDIVVAGYATRGVLEVGFTLSRQDKSGAKLADSKQDYTVNLRVEARNAMRRARRGP